MLFHLVTIVLEERGESLAIVVTSNGFSQQERKVENHELADVACPVLINGEAVSDNNLVDALACLQLLQTVTAKHTMSGHAVNLLGSTLLDHSLCGSDPRAGLVDHSDEMFSTRFFERVVLFIGACCGIAGSSKRLGLNEERRRMGHCHRIILNAAIDN
ncbi:hypothetical protein HG530_000852 [Fusarium avenaceum]|nr:hypothetical protein HG530_000852 [Fusarium avenaceum]